MLLLFGYLLISVGYVFGDYLNLSTADHEIIIENDTKILIYVRNFKHSNPKDSFTFNNPQLSDISPVAFTQLGNLKIMDLNSNHFSRLPGYAFSFLPKLKTLLLAKNDLVDMNFLKDVSTTLTKLDLSSNNLQTVPDESIFSRLKNLKFLSLAANGLKNLNFVSSLPSSLIELSVAWNKISRLPPGLFRQLYALQNLDLNKNEIWKLEKGAFDGLESINLLVLSRNKITDIPIGYFTGISGQLDSLVLSYNYIQILRKGTFVNAPKLDLSLQNNYIEIIEEGSFNLPTLRYLYLYENVWSDLGSREVKNLSGLPNLSQLHLIGHGLSHTGYILEEVRKYTNKDTEVY